MQAVARRYAVALADVVTSRGEAQEVREELAAWDAMVRENAQLLEVFRHPTIPYEQKRRVVRTLVERTRVQAVDRVGRHEHDRAAEERLRDLVQLQRGRRVVDVPAARHFVTSSSRACATSTSRRRRGRAIVTPPGFWNVGTV